MTLYIALKRVYEVIICIFNYIIYTTEGGQDGFTKIHNITRI